MFVLNLLGNKVTLYSQKNLTKVYVRRYLQFFVSKHCTSMACMFVIYPRETDLKLTLTLSLHMSLL